MKRVDEYSRSVYFSEEDSGFIAVCREFPHLSAFGETRDEALQGLEDVLEEVAGVYRDENWPLPAPHAPPDTGLPSGEFRLRLPKTLHAQLSDRAAREGVSQNALITYYLAQALARPRRKSSPTPDMALQEDR
jgi:predicted RNase H-like HicB family nuclease